MELIDRLNTDQWCASEPEKHKEFAPYTMIRPQMLKPGLFKYAVREVRDDEGDCELNMLILTGACGKSDPLASVRNMDLFIKDGAIVGINVEGDCVVRKDLL